MSMNRAFSPLAFSSFPNIETMSQSEIIPKRGGIYYRGADAISYKPNNLAAFS